jgi:dTDP-glucose 4,6-dehydratase
VPGGVYNIGGGQEHRNIALIETLCGLVDRRFESDAGLAGRYPDAPPARGLASSTSIEFVRDRPGHDRRYAIDFTRASADIGYAPTVSLEAGLERTLKWYLAGRQWWLPLLGDDFRAWIDRQYG